MCDLDDVRRIGGRLPGCSESGPQFSLCVTVKGKSKGFVWEWMECIEPKKPKVPNPEVLAISVANLMIKDCLIEDIGKAFVHDSHYDGYPAILVRLSMIDFCKLEEMVVEAWKLKVDKATLRGWEGL